MVKLASARESRTYGPGSRLARTRWEYINAGLYLFATALLVGGFGTQISSVSSSGANSGLVAVLVALALLLAVNAHDLVAHLAAVDYCLSLVEFDVQLALVEFAVPLVNIVGVILTFVGILFFLIQEATGGRDASISSYALQGCPTRKPNSKHRLKESMRYDIGPLWIVIVQFNSSSPRLSSVLHSFIGHVAGITEASHRINLLVFTLRCKNCCSTPYRQSSINLYYHHNFTRLCAVILASVEFRTRKKFNHIGYRIGFIQTSTSIQIWIFTGPCACTPWHYTDLNLLPTSKDYSVDDNNSASWRKHLTTTSSCLV
ncbi:hypothetical protein GW17_00030102 [Ensete ventricosum]|nr:hypothetical protein GW17_00030102 [Ensete ventricosum]